MAKKDRLDGEKVRAMGDAEITAALAELRTQIFDLRSQAVTEKVEDTSRFRKARKDIARLLTARTARLKKAAK